MRFGALVPQGWKLELAGLDSFVHGSTVLDGHCEAIGRDPAEIVRTHGPNCLVVESETELAAFIEQTGGDLLGEVAPER